MAMYAAQLPIPPWCPAEDRPAFITMHAGEAVNALLAQLDDIVDSAADLAHRDIDDHRLSAEEIAAITRVEQDTLLNEARSSILWDLTEAIAAQSAALIAEAAFTHTPRGQSREITHQAVSLCAISSRLRPKTTK